jgi:hypothetical protein
MVAINTTCPQCGAQHARKLSIIHAEGLTTTQSSINTVGKLNTIGGAKIKTTGTATGTHQTAASKNAAPPELATAFTIGLAVKIALMIAGGALAVGGIFADMVPISVIGVITILGSLVLPNEINQDERDAQIERVNQLREQKAEWERTFECGACGNRFIPRNA